MVSDNAVYSAVLSSTSTALLHSVERTTSIATSRSTTPYALRFFLPSPALLHSVERTTSIATSRSITPSALQYSVPRLKKKTICLINYNNVYRFFDTEDQCGLGLGSTLVSSPLNQDKKNVTQAYLGYIYALRSNRTHNPRVKRQKVVHVLDCAVVVIGRLKQRILPLLMSPHPIRDYHITRE
jgi:hypothetical protein